MHDTMEAVATLEKIVANPEARRELLWLRAREKHDEDTAQDLQRIDPGLEARLQAAHGAFDEETDFGTVYDQCLERHVRTLGGGAPARGRRRGRPKKD